MGFFSRIFGTETQATAASPSPQGADAQDDANLSAAEAAAVLAEIDIDKAIAAHENWKLRLQDYLDGKSSEALKPEVVCLDDRCDLGQWLHGPGKMRLGAYPAFSVLLARHQYFHAQASSVVALAQAGQKDKATQTLGSSYRYASNQVLLLLKDLKRSLGR